MSDQVVTRRPIWKDLWRYRSMIGDVVIEPLIIRNSIYGSYEAAKLEEDEPIPYWNIVLITEAGYTSVGGIEVIGLTDYVCYALWNVAIEDDASKGINAWHTTVKSFMSFDLGLSWIIEIAEERMKSLIFS